MQTRHCREHVGILAIYAMEYGKPCQRIEPAEASHIAWRMKHRRETIVHCVPWWRGRMHIVAYESNEVNRQECPSKASGPFLMVGKVKVNGENDRHWHPAQIEAACHEVGNCTMVNGKPLTRNQLSGNCRDAKQAFLCLVKTADVNVVELIIGVEVETTVYKPKQKPWSHVERESSRGLDGNEHSKQDGYQ